LIRRRVPRSRHLISPAKHSHERSLPHLRLGFVPLIDAAPLIIASELGYFDAQGLRVDLERQIGWGNVRDKLLFGHLDAAHALLGLPVTSSLDAARLAARRLVSVMSLGTGGDAITLSHRLTEQGITTSATFAKQLRQQRNSSFTLGHVFSSSVHHYLLREWLSRGQVDCDSLVHLAVVPPPQTASHLEKGYLDGFCVGEPWNTVAQQAGHGNIVCLTTDILPAHPDKVLAVSKQFVDEEPLLVQKLITAILRACEFCQNPAHLDQLVDMLALARHLDLDRKVIRASLLMDRRFNLKPSLSHFRSPDWHMRSFAPSATEPRVEHATWLLEQMHRWGHIDSAAPIQALAASSIVDGPYRAALREAGFEIDQPTLNPARRSSTLSFSEIA
jgi:two-component system, oxyanion-binding sensor